MYSFNKAMVQFEILNQCIRLHPIKRRNHQSQTSLCASLIDLADLKQTMYEADERQYSNLRIEGCKPPSRAYYRPRSE